MVDDEHLACFGSFNEQGPELLCSQKKDGSLRMQKGAKRLENHETQDAHVIGCLSLAAIGGDTFLTALVNFSLTDSAKLESEHKQVSTGKYPSSSLKQQSKVVNRSTKHLFSPVIQAGNTEASKEDGN